MVEPGQKLDKYQLIEKVGQGGMAVVYRGLDTSLKRQVAVKVLHHHLAEHREARERFEREAQAVAKLRHENILEIFDYSGVDSPESYIVTEFIDGQTLKEFVSERSLGYPEIGAMIAAQVCRALAHAHSFGILHRDVKPENIMIRSDGVLKLTDFGIAQMVDTNRLTVTGQLLGSPAYMSPEHVEGKPLDFRTDVFSVGILLYQMVTGELPFKGRNPHEILKRIAECEYPPPNEIEPKTGRELSRIIADAMAREKDDRYADVTQMLTALETYLRNSGLEESARELGRFFTAPASYEIALRERLVSKLSQQGRDSLSDDRIAALEYFNRVLTIDPNNAEVLAEIDRMSRRTRGLRMVALFGGVAAVAVAGFLLKGQLGGASSVAGARPTPADAGMVVDAAAPIALARADAGFMIALADASAADDARPKTARRPGSEHGMNQTRVPPFDAAPMVGGDRTFTIRVHPPQWTVDGTAIPSEFRVDDEAWQPYPGPGSPVTRVLSPGPHRVQARNRACCNGENQAIPATASGRMIGLSLPMLPASIIVECDEPGVDVTVDGRLQRMGADVPILFSSATLTTRKVKVVFVDGKGRSSPHSVRVRPKDSVTVKCAF